MSFKIFKSALEKYGLVSTSYAVPKLFRIERLYQKILWICVIVFSSLVSYLTINLAILSYLDYKVVTVTQIIHEQPTQFPTVTMCGIRDFFKIENLIIECFFGYDFDCKDNNLYEQFYSNDYGTCFRFNSGKGLNNHSIPILYSTVGGSDDSFNIKLNDSIDLAVWVHNRSLPPILDDKNTHYDFRVFLPSSAYTEIKIEKTIEAKLPEPYNQCLDDVNKFKFNKTIIDYIINKLNRTYTQQKCLELCFDVYYIHDNQCNCTNSKQGEVWINCWFEKEKEKKQSCTWNERVKFYSNNIDEKCSKYCPLECTSSFFSISTSTSPNYGQTRMKIFYANLKYTSITQEPKMELIDLVSGIGGTLSLLIGLNFVTFFEIIELIIEIIINFNGKL